MERGVGEGFPDEVSEELGILDADVVYLIARVESVDLVPRLFGLLSFPERLIVLVSKEDPLSPGGVHEQGDEGRYSRADTVIRQQRILELVFTNQHFGMFHVHFGFWPEYLDILAYFRGIILHGP